MIHRVTLRAECESGSGRTVCKRAMVTHHSVRKRVKGEQRGLERGSGWASRSGDGGMYMIRFPEFLVDFRAHILIHLQRVAACEKPCMRFQHILLGEPECWSWNIPGSRGPLGNMLPRYLCFWPPKR